MTDFSISDIAAVAQGKDNGMGNNWFLWIILIFFFLGGNGFGNRENGATAEQVRQGFDTNTIVNKLDGLGNGISSLGFNLSREIASCCCETNRNVDSVRAEGYKNTCEIIKAVHEDGEKTRALITGNKIAELENQVNILQTRATVDAQTSAILNAQGRYVLNPPCPVVPACNGYGTY